MWSKRAWRRDPAKPTLALAAKYWASTLHPRPTAAMAMSPPKQRKTVLSPLPASIIRATTRGTSRSKSASRSLKSGARILSFR